MQEATVLLENILNLKPGDQVVYLKASDTRKELSTSTGDTNNRKRPPKTLSTKKKVTLSKVFLSQEQCNKTPTWMRENFTMEPFTMLDKSSQRCKNPAPDKLFPLLTVVPSKQNFSFDFGSNLVVTKQNFLVVWDFNFPILVVDNIYQECVIVRPFGETGRFIVTKNSPFSFLIFQSYKEAREWRKTKLEFIENTCKSISPGDILQYRKGEGNHIMTDVVKHVGLVDGEYFYEVSFNIILTREHLLDIRPQRDVGSITVKRRIGIYAQNEKIYTKQKVDMHCSISGKLFKKAQIDKILPTGVVLDGRFYLLKDHEFILYNIYE